MNLLYSECVVVDDSLTDSSTAAAAEQTCSLLEEAVNASKEKFDWLLSSVREPITLPSDGRKTSSVEKPIRNKEKEDQSKINDQVSRVVPTPKEAHMSIGLKVGEKVLVGGIKVRTNS